MDQRAALVEKSLHLLVVAIIGAIGPCGFSKLDPRGFIGGFDWPRIKF